MNVLELCKKYKVKRLIFASTIYVYSTDGNFYKCSKQSSESFIEEYNKQYNLEYTILRYGSIYGPRSNTSNGIYRIVDSSETVEHQSTLYSTVQNPRNTSRFGSSVSFHGQNLAIEAPGEGDVILGDTHETTNLNIYALSASSIAVDKKLFGPIITGSSSNKAFVLKGSTSTSPEISEFPSVFSEKTG